MAGLQDLRSCCVRSRARTAASAGEPVRTGDQRSRARGTTGDAGVAAAAAAVAGIARAAGLTADVRRTRIWWNLGHLQSYETNC